MNRQTVESAVDCMHICKRYLCLITLPTVESAPKTKWRYENVPAPMTEAIRSCWERAEAEANNADVGDTTTLLSAPYIKFSKEPSQLSPEDMRKGTHCELPVEERTGIRLVSGNRYTAHRCWTWGPQFVLHIQEMVTLHHKWEVSMTRGPKFKCRDDQVRVIPQTQGLPSTASNSKRRPRGADTDDIVELKGSRIRGLEPGN